MKNSTRKVERLEYVARGRAAEAAETWVLDYVERQQAQVMGLIARKIGEGKSDVSMEAAMLVELRNIVLVLNGDVRRGQNSE